MTLQADLRLALRGGRPLLGAWVTFLDSYGLEALADVGYDWVGIDAQHGHVHASQLTDRLRAIEQHGVPTLVRLSGHYPAEIGRVLDAGASGIIVPMVESAGQAEAIAAATRFPPAGRRSFGASRSSLAAGYGGGTEEEPLLFVMIETAAGLAARNGISAVDGVDGLFVGPYDLSRSLGRSGTTHPEVLDAIRTVVEVARSRRLATGAFSGDAKLTALLPAVDLLAVDTDVAMLRAGAADALRAARDATNPLA